MLKHLKTYKLFESIDESVVDTIKAYIDELKDSDDFRILPLQSQKDKQLKWLSPYKYHRFCLLLG